MAGWQYVRRTTLQLVRGVELGKRRDKPGVHPTCTSQRGIGGHRRYATVNGHEKAVDTAAGIWPGQSTHRPSDEEWSGAGSDADLPLFSHCVDVGVPDPQLAMSGCSAIVALRLTLLFLSSRHERT